jgi:hypothetical protein
LKDLLRFALPERRAGYRSVIRRNEGARTIVLLLCVVLATLTVIAAIQWYETMRRTGTATSQLESSQLQLPSFYEQSPTGRWLRYTYVVDGTIYRGLDFRRWTNIALHAPKVCFDPDNLKDHFLVDGRVRCGGR